MSKSESLSTIKEAAGSIAAKAQASLATDTDSFARHASVSDLYEIQAADIAQRRSRRDDVKAFAQKMAADHSHTSEGLKAVMEHTSAGFTPPHALDSIHQTMIDDLAGAADEAFDDRYISQQEAAHNTALTLYRSYVEGGDDAAVCTFARQTVPTLEQHLEMVKRMKSARK